MASQAATSPLPTTICDISAATAHGTVTPARVGNPTRSRRSSSWAPSGRWGLHPRDERVDGPPVDADPAARRGGRSHRQQIPRVSGMVYVGRRRRRAPSRTRTPHRTT